MKTKKYLIAIAIFGGVLFTAQALNLDGRANNVERAAIKKPTCG